MRFARKTLHINGADRTFIYNPDKDSLADVLRRLGLTGAKIGCNKGLCGACTVILNGEPVRSCVKKMKKVDDYAEVLTVEGIGNPLNPHPIQWAFANYGAIQCGFCTPGFVVSAYALLQQNPDPTREEVRDWFQKHHNICRCTGYKQITDAVMAAAKICRGDATIEEMKRYDENDEDLYGKPVVRPYAIAKACGVVDYGDDVELKMPAETLHVALVQPKITHHAKIKKIDFSEAEDVPGLVKFVTYKDCKGTNRLDPFIPHARCTCQEATNVILCEDRIMYFGDVVALAVADTKEHAREAAAKVKVEIEELPAYLDFPSAAAKDAMRIIEDTDNVYCLQPVHKGDSWNVPKMIDEAEYSVEGSFYSSREPHLSIEGDTIQTYYDEDDTICVQCKSQGLYGNMYNVSVITGQPLEKLRMIMNPTGASFGWSMWPGDYALCVMATMATGMPCALSMTWEEHQAYSGKRCPAHTNARLAADKDGKFIATEFECGLDHGRIWDLGDDLTTRPARFMLFPYYVPNALGMCKVANTNHSFGIAYRGYGSPQIYTAGEALVDMMAEKIGMDPFEIRWRNIAREGQTNINSFPYKHYPMEDMMKVMKPIYDKAVEDAKKYDTPEKRRGVGLAWGGYNVTEGPFDACEVKVGINPDGTFTKYDTWQELGQGGDIGSLTVTYEALKPYGVKWDQIKLVQNDTGQAPDHGFSASSRSHFMNGQATKKAVDALFEARKKDDGTYMTYDEMVEAGIPTEYNGSFATEEYGNLSYLDPNTGQGDPTPSYTYGLFCAEVEVDTATGKATCIGYHSVDDVGNIGNLDAVNSQAYGGLAHTISFALTENYDDVKKHANMIGAGVDQIKDIPDNFTLHHMDHPREEGPWGSSGASEAFQSSGHMAVINAINNACGVRIYELPATKDKIKAGLDKLAAGEKITPPEKYDLGDFMAELEYCRDNPKENQ